MKRTLKVTGVAIVILVLLAFLSNMLMNQIFFNPYRNYENSSKVFYISIQTLMPNYSLAYISAHEPGAPKSFSRFSQRIFISQLSAKRDLTNNIKIQGNMSYILGKAKYVDSLAPSLRNVFTQNDFTRDGEIKEYLFKKDSYYLAHIAFSNPLSTEEIVRYFPSKFAEGTGELLRIIVETSKDKNAVAMGMDSQSSFFVFGEGGYTDKVTPHQMELIFKDNLQFLKENENTFQLYLKSGLFGDIELNVEDRINYISKHGFKNIGVALFVKEGTLQRLLQNPDFYLTFLEEDG